MPEVAAAFAYRDAVNIEPTGPTWEAGANNMHNEGRLI